jgi:hypothetical protein
MKKMNRLPHEQSTDTEAVPQADGLPASDTDVEGHRAGFLPGQPGTGGDQVRNAIDDGENVRNATDGDDVEGHAFGHTKGERFLPGMPGTGGDQVRHVVAEDDPSA